MKKAIWIILIIFGCAATLSAQHLTRFAVVDLTKVYTAFFRESRAVRDWEERSARVQQEIDRMNRELLEIRSKYADAVAEGDQTLALRLEREINQRTEFLREYYNIKTAELESQRRVLAQSGSFLEQVHGEIRFIAESEGYSMVMNLKESAGILWFSPTVDITDKVIQNLLSKSR